MKKIAFTIIAFTMYIATEAQTFSKEEVKKTQSRKYPPIKMVNYRCLWNIIQMEMRLNARI
jgi:hypothetical protein